ncbi:hypothetical protein GCM10007887_35430 [Methylobacterium haplocladii]|uniref:Chemotaxis protein n=1 Tax=Methylobacterium haplocladii TaxID=1176176 RepID=A0A512IV85_9HYPH|nr:hypothetical protein MHA02_39880 [Methylobacterium haplocladii]GJD84306.1 hypothetical protein HPGCJGGD_2182 [Methylobacterium haplocladii]GLS60854.1 hypothetical protein GCM10007887_35430 [Methylobacterium haplocladii]
MFGSQKTALRDAKLAALDRVQGVIEFDLSGTILDANPNFLTAVGYTRDEIVGRHHGIFVDADYRNSNEYRAFWNRLREGEFQAGQFKRVTKASHDIWIEASYNPLLGRDGKPYRIVKFATDITAQMKLLGELRTMIDRNFSEIDQALCRSTEESRTALDAARSTSSSVGTMAAATEELAASVAEVSESMAKSQTATESAFARVQEAGDHTRRLAVAANAMSGIIGLINTIAAQINLLALNATIEAARAGEAGRGFAVVAQEVKNLAGQAARATEQINGEIQGVQAISTEVVGALDSIQGSVDIMRSHVVATAAAVEEQSAVTRDMSVNMQEAARAVATIADNITAISSGVTQVSDAVTTTREAARVLAR